MIRRKFLTRIQNYDCDITSSYLQGLKGCPPLGKLPFEIREGNDNLSFSFRMGQEDGVGSDARQLRV